MFQKKGPKPVITLYFSKQSYTPSDEWLKKYGKCAVVLAQIEDAHNVLGNNFGKLEAELIEFFGPQKEHAMAIGVYNQLSKFCYVVNKPLKDEPYATKKAYVCYRNWETKEWWFQRQPNASEILYSSEFS
jgi:hypothetical protein